MAQRCRVQFFTALLHLLSLRLRRVSALVRLLVHRLATCLVVSRVATTRTRSGVSTTLGGAAEVALSGVARQARGRALGLSSPGTTMAVLSRVVGATTAARTLRPRRLLKHVRRIALSGWIVHDGPIGCERSLVRMNSMFAFSTSWVPDRARLEAAIPL